MWNGRSGIRLLIIVSVSSILPILTISMCGCMSEPDKTRDVQDSQKEMTSKDIDSEPTPKDPRVELDTTITEAIRLLEAEDFETFVKKFAPPDELKKKDDQAIQNMVKRIEDAPLEEAEMVVDLFRKIKKLKPRYEKSQTIAIFQSDPIGSGIGDQGLRFRKVKNLWYMDFLMSDETTDLLETTRVSISAFEELIKLYAVDHNGEFPRGKSEEVFKEFINPKAVNGIKLDPYLFTNVKDAWGSDLRYEYPTKKKKDGFPAIWSVGPDKQDDTADDVTNWK